MEDVPKAVVKEEAKPAEKPITITLKPSSLWQIISGVLLILLVASVWTGGFGTEKESPTGAVPAVQAPQQPNAPAVQTEPERIRVSAEGEPTLGEAAAKITLVLFSDFQCSYCARFTTQTLSSVKANYIDTGKVKLAFRNFPLSFHQNAGKAAMAAECANDQNKFFEMHDKIFAGQQEWSSAADPKATFKKYATELSLKTEDWESCYNSEKYKVGIQKDFTDGNIARVAGTPTSYLIAAKTAKNDKATKDAVTALKASVPEQQKDSYEFYYSDDGKQVIVKLVGSQPLSAFEQIIRAELS